MKRLFILLLVTAAVFTVSAQTVQDVFSGRWKADAFVIEQEDGLLVSADAEYSFPYLGITEMDFLDSGFVVFRVSGTEYRAFYEIEELDFDNYHISCSFKNGEEFLLKLVRYADGWRYLYRITDGSLLKGETVAVDEVAEESETAGEDVPEKDLPEAGAEELIDAPASSLYTGILTKLK